MEIRIGSFNMNNFGGSSNKDFGKIAEIIVEENLDVVALQEIFSEGRGVSRLLEQNVKYELYNWDYCFAAPSESRDITKMEDMVVKKTRSEGYAFLWKKSRFKKVEFSKLGETRRFEPRIINSLSKDVCVDCSFFARAPYYIRLQPIHGGFFELRLVNVHIFFGDTKLSSIEKRQAEYAVLTQQICRSARPCRYRLDRTRSLLQALRQGGAPPFPLIMRRRSARRPVRQGAALSRQYSSLPWTSSLSRTPRQHISFHLRASWAMTARSCAQTVQSSFDFSLLHSTHPDPPRRMAGGSSFLPQLIFSRAVIGGT